MAKAERVRQATIHDAPRLTEMGLRFLAETPYVKHIPANVDAVREYIESMVSADHCRVWVLEKSGHIVGMIGATLMFHPFSMDLSAFEAFWWVDPEHKGGGLKLYRRMRSEAKACGCVKLHMAAWNDRVSAFYRRQGFDKLDEFYVTGI